MGPQMTRRSTIFIATLSCVWGGAAPHRSAFSRRQIALGASGALLAVSSAVATPAVEPEGSGATAGTGLVAGAAEAESSGATSARGARPARGAAALLRERAKTGVSRTGLIPAEQAVASPGIFSDELRGVGDPSAVVGVSFSFPPSWTQARGPNVDLRNIRTSDGAFLLAAALPAGTTSVRSLPDSFFTRALFAPDGKYTAYGSVDDFKVISSRVDERAGVDYRTLDIKFAALSFNYNLVERRLLLTAAGVGDSVFMLAASALANRYETVAADLRGVCDSFRVRPIRAGRGVLGGAAGRGGASPGA